MSTTVTWLGHATFLIETAGHKILLDPFLNDSPTSPITAEEVQCDSMLISHGHFDHIADAASIARRTGCTVYANFEICEWLTKNHNVEKTVAMNLGGGVSAPFGRVEMTIAHHSSQLPDGSYGGNPAGFLLELNPHRIYFACDTALFSDMTLIGDRKLELAVLPIGDCFTMGPTAALAAVQLLRPAKVLPAHYNTWPPIEQDAQAWAKEIGEHTNAKATILAAGETLSL